MAKNRCCHPKCSGTAKVYARHGNTTWLVCLKCRMQFPDTAARRPK